MTAPGAPTAGAGDPPLDREIRYAVQVLREAGVATFESCQGGAGHAFPDPTIRFHGARDEGFRALAIALAAGLPVDALRRYWTLTDGEPTGPQWELTFHPRARLAALQRQAERAGRMRS